MPPRGYLAYSFVPDHSIWHRVKSPNLFHSYFIQDGHRFSSSSSKRRKLRDEILFLDPSCLVFWQHPYLSVNAEYWSFRCVHFVLHVRYLYLSFITGNAFRLHSLSQDIHLCFSLILEMIVPYFFHERRRWKDSIHNLGMYFNESTYQISKYQVPTRSPSSPRFF